MSITEKRRKEIEQQLIQYGLNHGFKVLDEYVNARTKMKCECIKHGHIFYKDSQNLKRAKDCPVCVENEWACRMNKNLPCVYDTHPDIAKCLKNQNEGYQYSHGSGKEFIFICPVCGSEIKTTMNYATTNGLSCKVCGDGKSYPNKLMYNMLTQLNIDFISEYHDDWTDGKFYDFYFCIDDRIYIVEMDGSFHYDEIYNSLEMQKKTDNYKDSLASEKGINLIRIDCNYTSIYKRFEYIKNNIINSPLSNIFDLSEVDFRKCDIYANMPIIKILSNAWNEGVRTLEELSILSGCHKDKVSAILKKSSDLGLIEESKDEIHSILCRNGYEIAKEKQKAIKTSKGRPVKILQTGEIFHSPAEAKRHYPGLKAIYDNLKETVHYAGEIDGQKVKVVYIDKNGFVEKAG